MKDQTTRQDARVKSPRIVFGSESSRMLGWLDRTRETVETVLNLINPMTTRLKPGANGKEETPEPKSDQASGKQAKGIFNGYKGWATLYRPSRTGVLAGFILLLFSLISQSPALCAETPAADAPITSFTLVAPAEAEPLLKKISVRMGEVKSFEASFAQEHHLAMYLDVLKAQGVCFFQSPDKFRWELRAPYRSILVYNRDRVAKFEEKDGALKYVESGAYDVIRGLMSQMTGWMRGDFAGDKEAFDLRLLDGEREYELELAPRAAAMKPYIQRIEVYLTKSPLRTSRIVIREPEEDYIEIRFTGVRENAALDPQLFDTKKPAAAPNDEK